MPFVRRDPEQFFRHLITDHCTYFNLNLLLEVSLAQPNAVSEENQTEYFPNNDQRLKKLIQWWKFYEEKEK